MKEYKKQYTSKKTDSTDVSAQQTDNSLEDFLPQELIMNNLGHAYVEVSYLSEEVVSTLYFNANTKELISIDCDFEPIVNFDAVAPESIYKRCESDSDKSIDAKFPCPKPTFLSSATEPGIQKDCKPSPIALAAS